MRRFTTILLAAGFAAAQSPATATGLDERAAWSVDANGPGRFIGVHGRRSSIFGYPATGLEIWSYPLQLISGYQVRFRKAGRIEPFEGQALLSRVESSPSEVVRIYSGPDFVVREHLFAPLDVAGVVLTYEVEGRADIQIEARFQPSLDLMWPGALGGQEILWSDAQSAYLEREPVHGFSAIIRSPETVAHDTTINTATERPAAMGLVMAPRRESDGILRARLVVAENQIGTADGAAALERDYRTLRAQTDAYYASVLSDAVEITTPDPKLNQALASSIAAGEQSWACAPNIGCGVVGGYGPSRPGRRPQYAWFFAGDGLVAVDGFLDEGRYGRARDELEFIAKYQNKTNGMIWHEMSMSAPLIDWERRYPYMFVHVDITLQYLSTLAKYVETTGDLAFARSHWRGIVAAWRYARSLVDAKTGLPSIPAGKQSQNEQAVLRDDVRMSASWIDAASSFADLARAAGDPKLVREGEEAAEAARQSVRSNYWDEQSGFWFGGHTKSGEPVREQRPDAVDVLLRGVFTDAQADVALDRLAGPDFQTDWGMRSLSSRNADYDPNAYASGAVWGLGSSEVSTIFWKKHRPFTAWDAWHGLAAWSTLDSPGHIHEVVAGDLFHPELESVPEQTWSSAGFLSAAVKGLLGLDVRGGARLITFSPHLPGDWGGVSLKRLRVGNSRVDLRISQDEGAIALEVSNPGAPVTIHFNPEVPLGARLTRAEVNGVSTPATFEQNAQDQHANVSVAAGQGLTRLVVRYAGGIRIAPVETEPQVGDASKNLKLVAARLTSRGALKLTAYVIDPAHAAIDLLTPMKVESVEGADIAQVAADRYRLSIKIPPHASAGYVRTDVTVMVRSH